MPLKWYQCIAMDLPPRRFKVYVGAKSDTSMSPSCLRTSYLSSGNGVRMGFRPLNLEIVVYNKIRLGLFDDAHKVMIDPIDSCVAKYGLKLKDEGSGEFVNTVMDTFIQPPAEWGPADYLFLINVPPPRWGEKAIAEILRASKVEALLVKRMRWSVGEIRTLTWKIRVPCGDVPKLVGSVFRGAEGDFLMQVISTPEYAARRERGNPKGGGGKGGSKGSAPSSRASVTSAHSCSLVVSSASSTSTVPTLPMECDAELKFGRRKR